jgi:hypothetical protein
MEKLLLTVGINENHSIFVDFQVNIFDTSKERSLRFLSIT